MRNALICAATMLALLFLWPLVFGDGAARADASTVMIPVPAPAVKPRVAPLAALPTVELRAPLSCRASLAVARRACLPGDRACGESIADAYDICEIRGAWPA